jgi:hypothetical protein
VAEKTQKLILTISKYLINLRKFVVDSFKIGEKAAKIFCIKILNGGTSQNVI